MKNKCLTIFVLFGFGLAFSQQSRALSLDEALRLGIENSKSLKIDEAKILTASANIIEANERKLPTFKVSASALALSNAKVDLKVMPKIPGKSAPTASSAMFGNANFTLPLFTGGRIKYGIESAKYLLEAQKLAFENNKTAIAYNIAQAYNNLFKAQQTIKVLEENLKVSEARDKQFLKLENNGIIARNDRLKANLQTSNIELQLLEAHNNYDLAIVNMDLLLGLPTDTALEIDSNYISDILQEHNVKYYEERAIQNRKDRQALDLQMKAAQLGTKSAKAERLPNVALTAGYIAAEVPKILSVYNIANIGLSLSYNIDNLWKTNTNLLKSQAREMELQASTELLDNQIKLEVNRDYLSAQSANKKINVLAKTQEQAEENYRITKNKYDNGLATITELLEADAAKISAKINYITAKADAVLAYKKLLQTTGNFSNN